ncbi:MAG: sulfur carrier protein ThiS [Dehalococcoidales bacterium]|nr:sulfur carrier protein ThiS [Dehalococcoidales bacterium]
MRITVNGKEMEVAEGLSIHDFITSRDLTKGMVIVELNQTVIQRQSWPDTRFKADDRVEIINILGGG